MEYEYSMPDTPASDILVIDTDVCDNNNNNDESAISEVETGIPGTTTHPLPNISSFQETSSSSSTVPSVMSTSSSMYPPSSSWEQESQSSWDMYLMKDKSKNENSISEPSCTSSFNEYCMLSALASANSMKDKAQELVLNSERNTLDQQYADSLKKKLKEVETGYSSEGNNRYIDNRYAFNMFHGQPTADVMKEKVNDNDLCVRSSEVLSSNSYVENVLNHPGQASLAGTTTYFLPTKQSEPTRSSEDETTNDEVNVDDSKQVNADIEAKTIGDSGSQSNSEQLVNVQRSFLMDKILGLSESVCDIKKEQSVKKSSSKGDKKGDTKTIKSKRTKPDKPPYTYVSMIAVAIMHSPKGHLSLPALREKLKTLFPFFNGEYQGWKHSVRHALSNSKCFYKVRYMDEQDMSTNNVWRVNYSCLKSNTFNRLDTACMSHLYKATLQEQLGLPPFVPTTTDIHLPPKPSQYNNYGMKLLQVPQEDFMTGRNESVPTPQSVISEKDSATSMPCPNVSVNPVSALIDRKRKRDEFEYEHPDTSSEFQNIPTYVDQQTQQQVYNMYNPYQNIQKQQMDMIRQQMSHDYGYYGYQENQPITTQDVGFYTQPYNQWFGYEHYYRQMLFNQCFAEHSYSYQTYVNNMRSNDTANVLDLSAINDNSSEKSDSQ